MYFLTGVLLMLVAFKIFGVRNYTRFFNSSVSEMNIGDRALVTLFAVGFFIDVLRLGTAALKYLP